MCRYPATARHETPPKTGFGTAMDGKITSPERSAKGAMVEDLVTRLNHTVVVTAPGEAKGPLDQARRHRMKVRMLLDRQRGQQRGRASGRRPGSSAA